MKPGLDRVEWLLGQVGQPHRQFRTVHVGGTNGKGSTSCMISSILTEHGITTGLYTSPHVLDFTERITVNGMPIAQDRVLDLIERLKPGADDIDATFFEIATAAAALYFAEEGVSLVVAEVGLGGRLDATNALETVLSVITKVAVDHTEILGSDIASIAAEKAGIIRENGVVVCGADGVGLEVIRGVAAARKARFIPIVSAAAVEDVAVTPGGSIFDLTYDGTRYERLEVSMLGRHQVENAVTAVVSVSELGQIGTIDVSEAAIRHGLSEACCTGRMQIIDRRPTVVADVAHNPDGMRALVAALSDVFDYERLIVVIGIMGDKDTRGMLGELADYADFAVIMEPATRRAEDPEKLSAIATDFGIPNRVIRSAGAAIERALSEADEEDLVLVTGSHYTVGDVMKSLGVGQALQT
jgi:dihydrofolate synthase/folylpolyglutamate synthase